MCRWSRFTLWTEDTKRGAFELERIAHSVETDLKRVTGTRDMYTIGGPGHVVRVLMDAERMAAFGISAQDSGRCPAGGQCITARRAP